MLKKPVSSLDVEEPAIGRLYYWEISNYLTCPVIGTCLSIAEQKKILRKARIDLEDLSEYEIHEKLVDSNKMESPLSRRIHRYLDNKFRHQISDVGLCTEATFFSLWRKGLKSGVVEALLWVGATNPKISVMANNQIFSDIHMLMHKQGELMRAELKRVVRLQKRNQNLQHKLKDAQKRTNETSQALSQANKTLSELEYKLKALEGENQMFKHANNQNHLQKENGDLRARVEKLEYDLKTRNLLLTQAETENRRIAAELDAQIDTYQLVQTELDQVLKELQIEEAKCDFCPNRDLCNQRILLVGGISKLHAVYRTLVEGGGGEFKYHNGNTKGGGRSLENLIGWADVVLCPVDVNSHGATLGVKKTCKKMDKPYLMLRSSSVSSIARALDEVAEDKC